jgi:hypothetical protein
MKERTHWLGNPNKNYLGHWDLDEEKITALTIKDAKWEVIKNPKTGEKKEQRVIHFEEDYKPMICNQTNAASIIKSTGIKYMEDSKGLTLYLYVGQTRLMGETVDCIRIKNNFEVELEKEMNRCKSLEDLKVLYESKKSILTGSIKLNDLFNKKKKTFQ